jgi:peptidoglycan hydrolase CwlO-like protein
MGLLERGQGGQLELSVGQAIDPEIRTQIRQLQTQRGQVLKAMKDSPDQIQALDQQLGEIDQQIADLNLSGNSQDFMPGERYSQPELDMPDPRPELDTYLAQLDELDDKQLREIHSRVYRDAGVERNAQELADAQAKVQGLTDRIAEIQAKADAGEVTPTGAKRMLTKAQKELAAAQQQMQAIEGRQRLPETLVGDQLELNMTQQLGLNLADGAAAAGA